MSLQKKLAEIQRRVKSPKTQNNDFGKYKYRSCEDILEDVKKHLGDLTLTINDEVVMIGSRYYVKATATIWDEKESISVSAFAREEETKKGMDGAQITGAASSYSRKYSLNGLFAIDDTKDADATNQHDDDPKAKSAPAKNKEYIFPAQFKKFAGQKITAENLKMLRAI